MQKLLTYRTGSYEYEDWELYWDIDAEKFISINWKIHETEIMDWFDVAVAYICDTHFIDVLWCDQSFLDMFTEDAIETFKNWKAVYNPALEELIKGCKEVAV